VEWSLHVSSAEALAGELTLTAVSNADAMGHAVREHFGDVAFTRVAFGTEFCENLIPGPASVREIVDAARARGLALTFLTPYVGNQGLERLKQVLPLVEGEVVFNDWGVLNLLRREFPRLKPVQGRLLNKSLRDPRITPLWGATAQAAPGESVEALRRGNLDNPSYTNFLLRMGVDAVELDNLPQGTDLSFAERGMRVSVYLPFGFISTARVCMAAALHYRKEEKFQPGAPCRHECQTHLVNFTYTNSPFQNRDQQFLLKGNTYFYPHTDPMLGALAAQARTGWINRVVYQPSVPMFA
jgi:hypothetical protein